MNRLLELDIEKLVYGGYGLAFSQGRAFFILNALPGERVRAEIIREKKNHSFGKSVEILIRSPLRIDAACPHFMRCGGCHLQHLKYLEQLRFKEAILRETFRRIAQITLQAIELVPGEPWHYRTRAQFKVARKERDIEIGFYAAQSHRLWPVDQCPLLADQLNSVLGKIQVERDKFLNVSTPANEFQLRTNHDQSQWAMDFVGCPPEFEFVKDETSLAPAGFLYYRTRFGEFRVGSNSFFQVNRFLLENLVERSVSEAKGQTALDLYSGVGLFTVFLAQNFRQVIAVEENPSAVGDFLVNVRSNGCLNVELFGSDVSAISQWGDEKWKKVDFVLMDPPRQGVRTKVLQEFVRRQIPACVYVSCDPTSMARDLKILCAGGYRINKILLFDFFPQTYHFETVAHLQIVR